MKLGIIGVGHLGKYLVQGFNNADPTIDWFLSNRSLEKTESLRSQVNCFITSRNQEVVEKADIIIIATRPGDVIPALEGLSFNENQIVVSVAAGIVLGQIQPQVSPAAAVRALPISCAAINKSPVLIYPSNQRVENLFSLLGYVHILPDEKAFSPGTALVGALYAWLFLLMDEAAAWTKDNGLDEDMARQLVIQTMAGACGMADMQEDKSFKEIWKTLATPGGISQLGADVLNNRDAFSAWSEALNEVTQKLKNS
jgi:pyrroline-5-carboxylate reductase